LTMTRNIDSRIQTLKSLRSFAGLGERDLSSIVRYGEHTVYRKQRNISYQSDQVDRVILVLGGRFSRLKYRADESCMILGKGGAGDWVGLTEFLVSCPYLYDAIAEEQTEALVYSAGAFHELIQSTELKDRLLRYLAKSVYLLHTQIEINSPYLRLVQHIMANCRQVDSGEVALMATQDEIAKAIGTTRETVNRYLQELQRKNLLIVRRGQIDIPELDALQEELYVFSSPT
jgi:CRP/FNR family transcriptional regulator, cyclic AMP receptor protein